MARYSILLLLLLMPLGAQDPFEKGAPFPGSTAPTTQEQRKQMQELLKQDVKDNRRDLQKMRQLLDSVTEELDKSKQYILPVKSVQQLEEIEKLSKKIRGRLKRF